MPSHETVHAGSSAAAIQGAINTAGPGGHVTLAPGTYSIDRTLNIRQPLTLEGRAALRRAPGFQGALIGVFDTEDVDVLGLRLDDRYDFSTPLADENVFAIHVNNSRDVRIAGTKIENITRNGIVAGQSYDVRIQDNLVADAKGVGQSVTGRGGIGIIARGCHGVLIEGNTGRRNWRGTIYGHSTRGIIIRGNTCLDDHPKESDEAGIERGGPIGVSYGCTDYVIEGNYIDAAYAGQGIEIDVMEITRVTGPATQYGVIKGNTIVAQGYAGITLYVEPKNSSERKEAHVTITGNVIRDCSLRGNTYYAAITVFPGITDYVVTANAVRQRGGKGYAAHGQNYRSVVADNRFDERPLAITT